MAQNIFRVYKQFAIDLLQDYMNFYKGYAFMGNGSIPTHTKEGTKAV